MNYRSTRMLESCLDKINDMFIWIGDDGRLLHANRSALDFYGYDMDTFTGMTIHDLDTHFRKSSWEQHWQALKRNGVLTITVQHRNRDGIFYPVEIVDTYMSLDDLEFSVAVVRSIAHREIRAQRMQLMEFSVDQMVDSALWLDQEGRIIFANDAALRNLGYTHDELVRMRITGIDPRLSGNGWLEHWQQLQQEETVSYESEHQRKDGRSIPVEVNANLIHGYQQEYNCIFVRDISERKIYEARLSHLATHDVLTGLPNRHLLQDRIDQAVLRARRNRKFAAILMIDLDRFKIVNDNLGHDAGDALLKHVASILNSVLRASDTVCRLGGDEFVVVLHGLNKPEECASVCNKVLQEISRPFYYGDHKLVPGASVGIAVSPEDGEDAGILIRNADIAMYQSKKAGGNNYQFYKRSMGNKVSDQLNLVNGLQDALDNNHFLIHFQPIFDLASGRMVSGEALLRWQDPERGLIPPDQFIQLAEESGLIVPIGNWVIEEVCRQNSLWLQQGLNIVPLSVNLSARQLKSMKIIDVITGALDRYCLEPEYLCMELTESMVMDDTDKIISILKVIKGLGVIIAIDDFGTGYSSLSYLQKFPIDVIKIDRTFIKHIDGSAGQGVIANAIIGLAHSLGYKVLAEGVENKVQSNYLLDLGCNLVQGFLFGRPVIAEEFEQLLARKPEQDRA